LGLLLILSATAFGQGGGGGKTTSVTKEPIKKEPVKQPPKNGPARATTTTPGFRFDGAYQLSLPEGKGVLWIRFLEEGDVLYLKAKDSNIEAPKNCLLLNPYDGSEPFMKPACEKIGVGWSRSNAPPNFVDANTFEFHLISSGSFRGKIQGSMLFLEHYGNNQEFRLFPSSPFKFYKMAFNEGSSRKTP
jgi:hypothetical protein